MVEEIVGDDFSSFEGQEDIVSSHSSLVKRKTVSAVLLIREGSVKGNSQSRALQSVQQLNLQRKERDWGKKRKRKGEEGKEEGKEEEEDRKNNNKREKA